MTCREWHRCTIEIKQKLFKLCDYMLLGIPGMSGVVRWWVWREGMYESEWVWRYGVLLGYV